MFEDIKQEWRRKRLKELLDKHFHGNKSALGQALGYKSGAFVRQMMESERPVSEKTVLAIERLDGRFSAWFEAPKMTSEQKGAVEASAKKSVAFVEAAVGDPVAAAAALAEFLKGLEGLPLKSAATAIEYLVEHPDRILEVQQQLRLIKEGTSVRSGQSSDASSPADAMLGGESQLGGLGQGTSQKKSRPTRKARR